MKLPVRIRKSDIIKAKHRRNRNSPQPPLDLKRGLFRPKLDCYHSSFIIRCFLTRINTRNPRLTAEEVGWISGSASTNVASFGGCAAAYPPFLSDFFVFYDRLLRVRY
jgi:hypothetical protein